MKKRTPLFLTLFLIPIFLSAQWSLQNSGTTSILHEVFFPSLDTGYVVGNEGTCLKTTNGGNNWNSLNSGTSLDFQDIHFVDKNTGFAIGGKMFQDTAIIIKTNDGGINWFTLFEGNTQLKSIFFTSNGTGFAVGGNASEALILKTTDSGENWNPVIIRDTLYQILEDVHFPSPDTGYIAFRSGIIKSVDAGNTWSLIIDRFDPNFPFSVLETIFFTDNLTGYIGGWYDGALMKTSNGGTVWENPDNSPWPQYHIYDLFFPSASVGYGLSPDGDLYKTINGGRNWVTQITSNTNTARLYATFFLDEDIGYAVGGNGTILKTINGGETSTSTTAANLSLDWSLAPNPFREESTLTFDNPKGQSYDFILFDILGQIVQFQPNITSNKVQLERNNLPTGHYVFQLRHNGKAKVVGKINIR